MTSRFINKSQSTEGNCMVVTKSSFAEGGANHLIVSLNMNEQRLIRKAVSDLSSEIERYKSLSDDLEVLNENDDVEDELREAECKCCGIKEECTMAYIEEIEKSFSGKWVCGLCSEVVKERMCKFPNATIDEALSSHRDFCNNFNSTRLNPKLSLTSSMREIAKRSSQKRNNSASSKLGRSISCDPRVGLLKN